jgi:phage shock protein A
MAQKVDQIEAESDASVELGNELTGDTLQQKFKALESGSAGTDTALAELKAKMGLAPAPAAKAALPAAAQAAQDESKIPSVLTTENRNK